MVAPIKQIVTVQPGGLIQLRSDQLPPGARAEVTVTIVPEALDAQRPLTSFIGAGNGIFKDSDEIDRYIREQRDWGDRDRDP